MNATGRKLYCHSCGKVGEAKGCGVRFVLGMRRRVCRKCVEKADRAKQAA